MFASVAFRGISENGESTAEPTINPRTMAPIDAAYYTAHKYPGGVRAIAQRMGMSANVLQNKVNPNNDTHHLTLAEAVALMDVSDNDAILMALAAHRGYDLMRTIPANTDSPTSLYWQAAAAHAEFMQAVADAMQAGATSNALRRISNRATDAEAHMHSLVGAVASSIPVPPAEVK